MPVPSLHPLHPSAPGPFVFLDRDGTIIEDRHYLADPAGVVLLPGAIEGLRLLRAANRRLVVVTNQSGIGRGMFSEAQMHAVNTRMVDLIQVEGIVLEGIYWCPHPPEVRCACRKPAPGLIERAFRELGGTLHEAAVVGDNASDLQLARNLGLTAVHVSTGRMPADPATLAPVPDIFAGNLLDAARQLLARSR